jgi:hypothetical protein
MYWSKKKNDLYCLITNKKNKIFENKKLINIQKNYEFSKIKYSQVV